MGPRIFRVERIETKDKSCREPNGIFVPVWRDWDSKYNIEPKMVYHMTITPGGRKGPHLHKQRTGYITCLSGKVELVLKTNNKYETILCDSDNPTTVEILPGVGLLAINVGTEIASLINICSPAWHPDNQDSYSDDYSDYK
jgi:dTDP-4-dehydrorhamnose 3,5-epimerase-like enzyme